MADEYIKRKRGILPISYREKRERRTGARHNGTDTITIITKLEKKVVRQAEAIGPLQKDLDMNNVVVSIN